MLIHLLWFLKHIYEDQIDLMKNVQLRREPFPSPKLIINPKIQTLEDLETWVTIDDFELEGYQHHDPIAYPFSVGYPILTVYTCSPSPHTTHHEESSGHAYTPYPPSRCLHG